MQTNMADKCVACGEVAEGKPLYKKLGSSDCQVEVFTALHEMQLLSLHPDEKNNHYICWDCDETIAEEYSTFISTEAKKKAVEAKRKQQDEARKIKLQKKLKQAFKKVHEDKLKASGEVPPVSKYKMREIKREENKYHASFCLLCKTAFEEANSRSDLRYTLQKMIDDENDVGAVLQRLGLQEETLTQEMKKKRYVCGQCYNKIRRNYKALCKGEVSEPLHFPLQENNDQLSAFKRRPTTEEHAAEIAKMIPPSIADLYKVVTNEDPQPKSNSKAKYSLSQGDRKSKRSRKKNPKYSSSEYSSSDSDNDDDLENGVAANRTLDSRNGLKETNLGMNKKVKIRFKNNSFEVAKLESPKTPTIRTLLPKGADEFGSNGSDVATPVSFTSNDSEIVDFGQCNLCGLGYNGRPKDFWYKLSQWMPSVMGVTVMNALKILDSELAEVSLAVREKELVCKPCFSRVGNGFRSQILRRIAEKKGIDVDRLELSKINVKMMNSNLTAEETKKMNGALNNNIDNRNNNITKTNTKKIKKTIKRSSKSPIADQSNSYMNGIVEEIKDSNLEREKSRENSKKMLEKSPRKISTLFPRGKMIYEFKRCPKSFKKTFAALQSDFELINLINQSRHLRYKGKVVLLNSVTVDLADLKGILSKSVLSSGRSVRLELHKDIYKFSNFQRSLKNKVGWDLCIICQKEILPIKHTTRWLEDPVCPPNLMVPLRWAHLTIADGTTDSSVNYATEDGKVCENCHESLKNKFGDFVGARVAKSHSLSSEKVVLEKYKVSFDSIAMNIVADPLEPMSHKESKKKQKYPGGENHSKNKKEDELGAERLPSKMAEKSDQESEDSPHNFVNKDESQENTSNYDNSKSLELGNQVESQENTNNYNDSKSLELGNQVVASEDADDQFSGSKLGANNNGDVSITETKSGYAEESYSPVENKIAFVSNENSETTSISEESSVNKTNPSKSDEGLNTTDLDNDDERDQDTLSMDLRLSDTSSDSEAGTEETSDKTKKNSDAFKAKENSKDFNVSAEDHNISIEKDVQSTNVDSAKNEQDMLENIDSDKTNSTIEKAENEISEANVGSTECTPDANKDLLTLSIEEKNDKDKTSDSVPEFKSLSASVNNLTEDILRISRPPNSDEHHSKASDDVTKNTFENLNESFSNNEDKILSPNKDLRDTNLAYSDHVKGTDDLIPEINDSLDQNCVEKESLPKKRKSSETSFTDKTISKKKCLEPKKPKIKKKRIPKKILDCKVNGIAPFQPRSDNSGTQNSECESDNLSLANGSEMSALSSKETTPSKLKEILQPNPTSVDEATEGSEAFSSPEKISNTAVETSEIVSEEKSAKSSTSKRKCSPDLEINDSETLFPNFTNSFMVGGNEEESELGEDNIAPFAQRKKFKKKNHANENQKVLEKEALQGCVEEIWHTIQGISLDDLIFEGIDFPLRLSQYNIGFLLALNDLRVHLGASLEDLIGWIKKLLPFELRVKGIQPSIEKISTYLLSLNNSREDLSSKFLKEALPEELFHVPKSYQINVNQDKRSVNRCYIEDVMKRNDKDNIRWEDFLVPVNMDNLLTGKPSRVSWNNFNNGLLYALWKVNKMMNGDDENFINWLSLTSTTIMKDKDYIAMSKAVIAIDKHLENYPEEINRLVAPIVVRSGFGNKTDDNCPSKNTIVDDENNHYSSEEGKVSSDGDLVVEQALPASNSSMKKKSSSMKKLARVLPQSSSIPVQMNNIHSIFDPHVKSNEGILNSGTPGQVNSVPLKSQNCQHKLLYNGEQNVCSNNTPTRNFVVSYESDFNRAMNNPPLNHPVQMLLKVNSPSITNPLQTLNNVISPVSKPFPTSIVNNQNIHYQTNPQVTMPLLTMRPAYSPAPTSVSAGVPMIPILNSSGYMTMVPLSVRMPVVTTSAALQPRFSSMPIAVQPVTHHPPVQLHQGITSPHIYAPEIASLNATPTNERELVSKVNSLEQQLLEIQKQNSQLLEMKKLYENKFKETEKDRSDTPSSSGESVQSEIPKNSQSSETSSSSSRQHKQRKSLSKTGTNGNKNPKLSFEDALNYNRNK